MSVGDLLLDRTDDCRAEIHLRVQGETVWLTQAEMAELFQTSVSNISIHINNILESGEFAAEATTKENLIVRQKGTRQIHRNEGKLVVGSCQGILDNCFRRQELPRSMVQFAPDSGRGIPGCTR